MADGEGEFSFSKCIYVGADIRIDIFVSIRPMTTIFSKQVHLGELIQMKSIKQVLVTSSRPDNVIK